MSWYIRNGEYILDTAGLEIVMPKSTLANLDDEEVQSLIADNLDEGLAKLKAEILESLHKLAREGTS